MMRNNQALGNILRKARVLFYIGNHEMVNFGDFEING
ncbi:hypothetical protein PCPL58_2089 [Pseudomonas cerasi]|uniref:Uncharacterized protein n=1 Tax=Pseudomonas cerasi TaxID=1583341 RepID=A0A193SND6_9PSED|nr:hypothetical protein PCPL58_2089 [Pseudomonas cerasi]SOS19139.1 hypothetical protein PL963_02130 [Pseudomonas cerasi]